MASSGGNSRQGRPSPSKLNPAFTPSVKPVDENTPLVASSADSMHRVDSIESWGLYSRSESQTKHPDGWRERLSSKSGVETWNFPGWGTYDTRLMASEETLRRIAGELHQREGRSKKLTEWEATAICANDILSSCLYVVGLVCAAAGKMAPLALLVVSCVLYMIKGMYAEAITALPMNGGSYNVLLNSTSKGLASFAATLALVSYIATGVVSGTTAIDYLQRVVAIDHPLLATIGLLLAFAVLVALGIKESARVAQAILLLHIVTLAALCLAGAAYVINDPSTLRANLQTPFPDVELETGNIRSGSFATALFFGYASAILGVSGFESSSQFVQSQGPGVFVKTLRNMWVLSAVFNPLVALLALGVLPLPAIMQDEYTVLARMGRAVGDWASLDSGAWLEAWISIDAFIVLSGALLTAYVGVNGLIERMASDRCLPQFLLARNAWRGTCHNIIFGYFCLAALLVVLLRGDVEDLAGVYSFAFLFVLCMFSIGVMLIKYKRTSLPREATVHWRSVTCAFLMVVVGLLGNLMGNPEVLAVFVLYVAAAGALVLGMIQWSRLLSLAMTLLRFVCPGVGTAWLEREIDAAKRTPAVFFCKNDDVYVLNKAVLYVTANEQTSHLIVVHVHGKDRPVPPELAEHVRMIDEMYPKLKITLVIVEGVFGPPLIEWLSRELHIPKNAMFITAPDATFAHKLDSLGGARIITH